MEYITNNFAIYCEDNIKTLKSFPDNCIDAIVTDPPYGINFMGKKWDYDVPSVELWEECFRVLKPGGHVLSFAGTRTQHRMAVNIEDAGFEIRDMIAWVYGSGFPKSHNVSNSIDKFYGCSNRGHAISSGSKIHPTTGKERANGEKLPRYESRTEHAQKWDGWGTALKPALEPITLARKPFKGTVANNVLEHGTGGLNIDGCRVGNEVNGRFPANFINDGSDEVFDLLPENAHRFFYVPKCSKKDRNEGLDDFDDKIGGGMSGTRDLSLLTGSGNIIPNITKNNHPTVKPTDLMSYLVRMITPPNGVVLDPFMGSGSTGKATMLEGFKFIGIDITEEYFDIAKARIEFVIKNQTILE